MLAALAYWCRTLKRAWSKTVTPTAYWRTQLGGGAIAAAIIGSLFYWAFQGWPKVSEEWGVWLAYSLAAGGCLFVLAFLKNLFRAPADMEHEQSERMTATIHELNERITALEDKRKQVLEFDFRPEDNKFLDIKENIRKGQYSKTMIGRVAVKNTSEDKTIRSLQTRLVHLWKDGEPIYETLDFILESYSSGEFIEDLQPRNSITYNLFNVETYSNGPPRIALGPGKNGRVKKLPAGRYRLKVSAFPADLPPLTGVFLFEVTRENEVTYRPWREGDSQHELNPVSRF